MTSEILACRMGLWDLRYPISHHCCLPRPAQTSVFISLYLLLIYWDDLPGDWRARESWSDGVHLFKTVVIKIKLSDLSPVVSRMKLVTLGKAFPSLASVFTGDLVSG